MTGFDASRESAIRAGLISRVAEDVGVEAIAASTPGNDRRRESEKSPVSRWTRRRRTEWIAVGFGILLVGGVAGGIYAAAAGHESHPAGGLTPSLLPDQTPSAAPMESPSAEPTITPPPQPTSTPTPEIEVPAPPVTPPDAAPEEVTFTYDCWIVEEGGTRSVDPPRIQFDTLEEVWATDVPLISCEPIRHGTEYTETQRLAVERADFVLPLGLEQLEALYGQCALRNNGYINMPVPFAENQVAHVRGFLTICPQHPQAAELEALLP